MILYLAVGILYSSHINFVNVLEPSNLDEYLFGPKTFIFFCSKKSTIPSTKGFSGPTITRSILVFLIKISKLLKFDWSMSTLVDIIAVPAFPGEQ